MAKFSFANVAKKEKAPLTRKQQIAKTVINWVVSIICVAIIIIALAISILTITRTAGERGIANIFGNAFMPVQTDSMSGTFEENDLIITKIYEGNGTDLKVGQVITYETVLQGIKYFNTHRIVEVVNEGNAFYFRTKGDNSAGIDNDYVTPDRIVATWGTPASMNEDGTFNITDDTKGKNWGQIGKAINWLQKDRVNYFLVIVLPLILLFVIYAFVLIRTIVIAKIAKSKREAAIVGVDSLSDEEKNRLRDELLAQLAAKGEIILPPVSNSDEGTANSDSSNETVNSDSQSDDAPLAEPIDSDSQSDDAPLAEPIDSDSQSDDSSNFVDEKSVEVKSEAINDEEGQK